MIALRKTNMDDFQPPPAQLDALSQMDKLKQSESYSRTQEADMGRMFVDCRDYPSEMNCTVAISADSKKELLEAAVHHAVAVHGHQDSPQLRHELAKMIKTQ
jgi:predicted small metal-binding protein